MMTWEIVGIDRATDDEMWIAGGIDTAEDAELMAREYSDAFYAIRVFAGYSRERNAVRATESCTTIAPERCAKGVVFDAYGFVHVAGGSGDPGASCLLAPITEGARVQCPGGRVGTVEHVSEATGLVLVLLDGETDAVFRKEALAALA